ncbi:rhodanese-like domain-containing protein [Geomicrobium sp. JCM 19038]|uniref:rhodanese-like domain-containing protein n=1 Tax=Geomicrobium sp. JCM 19038 TaxID=1460635 RepID=UPI00045F490D|nr:rhodanese-like domain-containing protein [Geomicrobium sp. JCM 19038]GAK09380.1 rhodanese-like domain protein [Geomicrobium sp. JCM 19038]
MKSEKEGITQWDYEELQKNLHDEHLVFIDVREPDEYEEGHIPGVPLMPMGEVPERLADMDSEKTHVFICRSGGRSQRVAQYAKENGFDRVINFDGGMLSFEGEKNTGEEKRIDQTSELYSK